MLLHAEDPLHAVISALYAIVHHKGGGTTISGPDAVSYSRAR